MPFSTAMLTQLSYLVAAALFILGLKRMSSPLTAVSGVRWAGAGMLLATIATFAFVSGAMQINLILMLAAIAVGGGIAAAIAAVELYRGAETNLVHLAMAVIGGFIGSVSFSGSLIAFAKLQGLITKSVRFGGQKFLNLAILLV